MDSMRAAAPSLRTLARALKMQIPSPEPAAVSLRSVSSLSASASHPMYAVHVPQLGTSYLGTWHVDHMLVAGATVDLHGGEILLGQQPHR